MKRMTWMGAFVAGVVVAGAAALRTAQPSAAVAKQWGPEDAAPAARPRVLEIGRMSTERAAHQATSLPTGQVLVTGGCGGGSCDAVHASAELYDPATRSFRPAAPMATPRASHAAVALSGGRVLVTGGWTGREVTASAEIYDPATGRWTAAGDMLEPRASPIAVPLRDGRVLIVGGGEGGLGHLPSAEIFDPASGAFSPAGRMRSNHYLATPLRDGRVLLTGGQGPGGEILRSAELFDPATGAFQPTGDMAVPRVKHAAAPLPDGRVLIIGGSDRAGYRGRFASTEIYDPATGRFSPGPPMHAGRHKIRDAVAVLPSGAVLVAGGAPRPELWDPEDGVFVPADGALGGAQMFATATRLRTGEVLVLGGYDERIRSSASAWLVASGR